jgi:hypothetical protein
MQLQFIKIEPKRLQYIKFFCVYPTFIILKITNAPFVVIFFVFICWIVCLFSPRTNILNKLLIPRMNIK